MGVLEDIIDEAEESRPRRRRNARNYRILRDFLGGGAAIAGVVAGGTGIAASPPAVTGVAGFTAALLAGLHTVLQPDARAIFNQTCAAEYFEIAFEARWLRERGTATEQEIKALIRRLTDIRRRSVHANFPAESSVAPEATS